MFVTICDDTWNVLNMQHITPNLKRWDYSDIPCGGHKILKDLRIWLKVATTSEKHPSPKNKSHRTSGPTISTPAGPTPIVAATVFGPALISKIVYNVINRIFLAAKCASILKTNQHKCQEIATEYIQLCSEWWATRCLCLTPRVGSFDVGWGWACEVL